MTTRLQRGLRLFIALLALSCGVLGAAEPVAAAPSCYPAALALPSQTAAKRAVAVQRDVASTRGCDPQPSAADLDIRPSSPLAPTLVRAPRLYLRHCVLLR